MNNKTEMLFVDFEQPGGPEVLKVRSGRKPLLRPGEVLIEVHAAGVNRPDLMQRQGRYPPPEGASPVLGLEVAGNVIEVSPGCDVETGEAVCALVPGGGYAEYCAVPSTHCIPIPRGWTMVEAAGIPETFFTVWANLFVHGALKEGERVLIHGGASGIGTTAVQLARACGAEVYATAGSDAKCEAVTKLGASEVFNYKQVDFEAELKRVTAGAGVNLILDMVGGTYTPKNLASLAFGGRLVQIATQGGAETSVNLLRIMQKRLTITGSTMRPRSVSEKADIARSLHQKVWPLLETRKVRVIVDRIFPLDSVRQAHEYLEAGNHIGKVILALR